MKYFIKITVIVFTAALVFNTACSPKDPAVAKFGSSKITLEEFKIAYLNIIKKPDVFDSKKLREQFLDELIATRVLAIEANKINVELNELLKAKVKAFNEKTLRDEHYDFLIKPKVTSTDQQIENTYRYMQEERRVSHLYASTFEDAENLHSRLRNGEKFEQLAKEVFTDTALSNNGGDLGWVYWDQMDLDMANKAYSLNHNEFSGPIKSQHGYHILKVTEYKKKPLITRSEYEQHKRKAKYLLEHKIGEKIAFEHISKLLMDADIKVYPNSYNLLQHKLTNKFHRKPEQFDQMFDMQLRNEEVKYVEENLWDFRDSLIAKINGQPYTVGDFIGTLNFIPYDIIHSSFNKTMDYAIRDFVITEEAKELGLQNASDVKRKVRLFEEFLLALEVRREIVSNVTFSEEEVKDYYAKNANVLGGAKFEDVENFIKDILKKEKKRNAVPKHVKSLLNDTKVTKNLEVLHAHYDSILN